MEEWKDIKGYEGLYQISNKGRVKSLGNNKTKKEKILKPRKCNGYFSVRLCKKGEKPKPFDIHRLVAEHFLPNPDNLPVVNHKDENKLNNNVENLEWCTFAYNTIYSVNGGKPRKIQCVETQQIFDSSKDVIDKIFPGRSTSVIRDHLRGRTKSAFGFHFKFIDE